MSYNKNKSYTRPPRTRKSELCYCQACKGKLVDPRTKASHARNRIIPQREITSFSEIPENPLIFSEDMDIDYEEGPQEESYQFLVKRIPIAFQKKIERLQFHF